MAESAIVGTAVGLAIRGYRAVCEIQFDGFVYPAFDQIVSQVAKLHKRSDGAYNMAMVIRIPFQGGIGAIEHHSESPEPYFAQTAGLRVVSCSTPNDAYWMIQQSIEHDDPIIFCEPKSRYWEKGEVDLDAPPAGLFDAVVRREGSDVTLIGYGASMKTALRAAETAAVEGTSIEVIDARSIAPLDIGVMAKSLEKTGRVVVVQESPHTASVGSEIVSELIAALLLLTEGAGSARERLPRAVSTDANRRGLPTNGRSDPRRRRSSDGIRELSEEIFLLPDVGEGLTEAEIVTWKVQVGDVVVLNQPLVDIETAKATVELPSPYAGTVTALHGNVGDVLEVHKPLITFEVGGGAAAAPAAAAPAAAAPSEPAPAKEASDKQEGSVGEGREAVLIGYGVANEDAIVTRKHRRQSGTSTTAPGVTAPAAAAPGAPTSSVATLPALAPRSTPPVRLYAKQHGVDISSLTGTGRDGLITRGDVEQALSGAPGVSSPRVTAPITGPNTTSRFVGRELESWSTGPEEERIPVKGVLRSMAEAMVQSAFTQPRAAVWVRVDATRTMDLVASLKQQPNLAGVRLSPLAIIALAVCDAARHFPGINSSFDATANEVIVRRTVNLGIAADTPRGLIVPNIKGADQLDLVGMAAALTVLVDKARAGTTTPNEMIGTTLSITNVGPFGVDAAIPILPPGTGAILAVGQIAKAPWVVDDEVVVRQVVELAMAFDHRQVDGAMASAVLSHIGRFLHDPAAAIIAG